MGRVRPFESALLLLLLAVGCSSAAALDTSCDAAYGAPLKQGGCLRQRKLQRELHDHCNCCSTIRGVHAAAAAYVVQALFLAGMACFRPSSVLRSRSFEA